MAIVKKYTYGVNSWAADASLAKAFFDSFTHPLIKMVTLVDASTLSLNIDDVMTVRYDFGTSNSYHAIKLVYAGAETSIGDASTWGQKVFTVVSSDDFLKINLYHSNTNKYNCFVYEKTGNQTYYGSSSLAGDSSAYVISNITITNISSGTNYKHGVRLNYPCEAGYLDYTDDVLFLTDGQRTNVADTNTLSCTTITAEQVVTFGGHNYYSIGTNTLIPMDSE